MGWQPAQRFTVDDDPDRLREHWEPPAFVQLKDPRAQRVQTSVEDFQVKGVRGCLSTSFARVVRGVLDEEDCAELVASVNRKGFTPALLNVGKGYQVLAPDLRDGHRVIVDWPTFTSWLFEVLRPHLPERLRGAGLVDLNERCRFLCYTPGQHFVEHADGRYARPGDHANSGDFSLVTLQLYLHLIPTAFGGGTTFIGKDGFAKAACQPGAGDVLLFTQELHHEGSLLEAGLKYTLRTEAMYRRTNC